MKLLKKVSPMSVSLATRTRSALASVLALASAAGLALGPVAGAEAQTGNLQQVGIRDGQNCALQYVDNSLMGLVLIKAAAGQGGSYRLTIRRANDANDVLVQMSGDFNGSPTQETLIGQAQLRSTSIYDIRTGQRVTQGRQVFTINGSLELFDENGRRTCRTRQVDVLRFGPDVGAPAAPQVAARPASQPLARRDADRQAPARTSWPRWN